MSILVEETLKYSFLEIELYREVLSMKETLTLTRRGVFLFFFGASKKNHEPLTISVASLFSVTVIAEKIW